MVAETFLPAPDRSLALTGGLHDLSRAATIGRQKDDLSATNVLLRAIAISDQGFKLAAVGSAQLDIRSLVHNLDSHTRVLHSGNREAPCLNFAFAAAILDLMVNRKTWLCPSFAARSGAVLLGLALLTMPAHPAEAHGGHGLGRVFGGHSMHSAPFAGGLRHGNDAYIKAATEERDKLLETKLKSICRGC